MVEIVVLIHPFRGRRSFILLEDSSGISDLLFSGGVGELKAIQKWLVGCDLINRHGSNVTREEICAAYREYAATLPQPPRDTREFDLLPALDPIEGEEPGRDGDDMTIPFLEGRTSPLKRLLKWLCG